MKRTLVAAIIGMCCALGNAQTPSSYICVADKSTGFVFDKVLKEWNSTSFRADTKYVISRSTQKGKVWEVKEVGKDSSSFLCKENFTEYGHLFCEGFGGDFRFNKASLRYMGRYPIGYWNDANPLDKNKFLGEEGSNTPHIEIGRCSPL